MSVVFFAAKLLGDLGADVVKIEKPGGDPARNIGPFYRDIPDPQKSLYWFAYNSSKRGITLDVETHEGQVIFNTLAKRADVVLESFAPEYMERLGLGYAELSLKNPGIIVTSITGFGQSGPYKNFKAPDIVIWALSGNAYVTGDPDRPPLTPSFPLAYIMGAALQATVGTVVAVYQRGITGLGQHVDVSAELSSVLTVAMDPFAVWEQDRTILKRAGRSWVRPLVYPNEKTKWLTTPMLYECKDGDICFPLQAGSALGISTAEFAKWVESEGMASDTLKGIDWTTVQLETAGQEVIDQCNADFNRFFLKHTKAELLEEAQKRGIMLYPVMTPKDILEFEQLKDRNYWAEVEHAELGETITYPGHFARMENTSCQIRRRAPLIGEHNEEIYLNELGISRQEMVSLKKKKVI